MAKFYVAENTTCSEIFTDAKECIKYVRGHTGARVKKFKTKEMAQTFIDKQARFVELKLLQPALSKTPEKEPVLPAEPAPVYLDFPKSPRAKAMPYAFVDGSYNKETGTYGYGVVFFDGRDETLLTGSETNTDLSESKHLAGEFLGAIRAVEYAIRKKISILTIYYDYSEIANLAMGRSTPNEEITDHYVTLMTKYQRKIKLLFAHAKSHSDIALNDKADILANIAVYNIKDNRKK